MAVLNRSNSTLVKRAAEAMLAYLGSLPDLAEVNLRRDDDPRERPFPVLVVGCFNFRQSWAGSDEHEGELRVTYVSGRDEDANDDGVSATPEDLIANRAAHETVTAAISNALEDQDGARNFLNADAENRPVTDFHFYATVQHQEDGDFGSDNGTAWQTDFMRVIKCARRDY